MGYVPHERVGKRIRQFLQDLIIQLALLLCRWGEPAPEPADKADRFKKAVDQEAAAGSTPVPASSGAVPVPLGPKTLVQHAAFGSPPACACGECKGTPPTLYTRNSLAAVFKAVAAREADQGGRSKPFMDGLSHGLKSAEVLLDELARRMGQAAKA
jgi:hypothetical protein